MITQNAFEANKKIFTIFEPADSTSKREPLLILSPADVPQIKSKDENNYKCNSIETIVKIAGKRKYSESKGKEDILTENLKTQLNIERKTPGKWTEKEHALFLEGMHLFGKNWKKIEKHVLTRTCSQIRSHAQKYSIKINKGLKIKIPDSSVNKDNIESFVESKNKEETKKDIIETPNISSITSPQQNVNVFNNENSDNPSLDYLLNLKNKYINFNFTFNSLQNLFNYFYLLPFEESRYFLNDLKSIAHSLKSLNYGNCVILNKYLRQIDLYIHIHDFEQEYYKLL